MNRFTAVFRSRGGNAPGMLAQTLAGADRYLQIVFRWMVFEVSELASPESELQATFSGDWEATSFICPSRR